jgi:SAM-dependent methyltransferase
VLEAVVSADSEMTGHEAVGARYQDVLGSLRTAYDGRAEWRDQQEKAPWKLAERQQFLGRLLDDGGGRLLEIGAGPGHDSAYFASHGLQVVATDLSPAMVALCRRKGLDAHVMDFLHLDFPAGFFDAVYALNCLLHVPNADLPRVLAAVRAVLRPGGWLYLGVYGGNGGEGTSRNDLHEPARFFSWRTDEQIRQFVTQYFTLFDFHVIAPGRMHFQSLTLRCPA